MAEIRKVTVDGREQVLIPRTVKGQEAGGQIIDKAQASKMAAEIGRQIARMAETKAALESDLALVKTDQARKLLAGVVTINQRRIARLGERKAQLEAAAK